MAYHKAHLCWHTWNMLELAKSFLLAYKAAQRRWRRTSKQETDKPWAAWGSREGANVQFTTVMGLSRCVVLQLLFSSLQIQTLAFLLKLQPNTISINTTLEAQMYFFLVGNKNKQCRVASHTSFFLLLLFKMKPTQSIKNDHFSLILKPKYVGYIWYNHSLINIINKLSSKSFKMLKP